MPTFVRVRNVEALRERIEKTGRHVDVAYRAGINPVRLSQILGEKSPVLRLDQAAKLEEILQVDRGSLFVLDDPDASADVIGPYLVDAHPDDREAGTVAS